MSISGTYINFSVKTVHELEEYILEECGLGLNTVEITQKQLTGCINTAIETYTKWATGPTKYLALCFEDYTVDGFDMNPWRVSAIEDVDSDYDNIMGNGGGENLWSIANTMYGGGMYPRSGNNLMTGTGWVTVQMMHEYKSMAKRMMGRNWEFEFNQHTGFLKLIPDPYSEQTFNFDQFVCVTVETVPEVEPDLVGNDIVKELALARAMMIVGRVRKKFESIPLLGGGQVDTSIFDEGKELWDKTMEDLQVMEGPSFGLLVG